MNDHPPGSPLAPPDPAGRTLPLDQALALAERHQAAGRLPAAEALCLEMLRVRPGFAPAMHLLGIVHYQAGRLEPAIEWVSRAVEADDRVALFHCNLGEMNRLAGHREAALAEGLKALALDPDMAQAWNNVGIAHYESDDFEQAVHSYSRAIALAPGYVEAHSNLGNALRALHRYDEALAAYGRALELQPGHFDALNNMGTALRDMGRLPEAEAAYGRALALKPDSTSALNNLALAYKEREQFDQAALLLVRSLVIDPGKVQTLTYLALVRLEQDLTQDAEVAALRAVSLDGEDGEALNALGLVRFEQLKSAEALELFQRAVANKPSLADAHNNIANILKEDGRIAEALEAYERAIAFAPHEAAYYVNYSDPKKFTDGDPYLLAMEEIAAHAEGLSSLSRCRLNFALGKAYDDVGRYDDAFASFLAGNRLKRGAIAYDEAATLEAFDRIARVFDRGMIARAAGGFASPAPIFIVGMPRSGTTLIEQILGSHPSVHPAGELADFNWLVDQLRGADGAPLRYPDDAPLLDGARLRGLGQAYVERLRGQSPAGSVHITDKMPANFLFLGLIHMALPEARILHVSRDPVDTCLSCYFKLFSGEQNFAYDLGELGRYYRSYVGLMAHWRRLLPEGVMLDVRYEDVVGDLEGQARRMLAHCGLDWDDRCIAFHKTRRPVRTASASQVRQPLYQSSKGRWRHYQAHLGELIQALCDVLPADGATGAARRGRRTWARRGGDLQSTPS